MDFASSYVNIDWDLDLAFLQDQPPAHTGHDQSTLMNMVTQLHRPQPRRPPPAGTIYMYSTLQALQEDEPVENGQLGQMSGYDEVRLQDAQHTHKLIRKLIRDEFRLEDRYRQDIRDGGHYSPRDKRRRNPLECEWKPESVYKTYGDCKPEFFDKSDYQDNIPYSSCFGKINMRTPKAWSRGPNKPKRKRRQSLPARKRQKRHIKTFLDSQLALASSSRGHMTHASSEPDLHDMLESQMAKHLQAHLSDLDEPYPFTMDFHFP